MVVRTTAAAAALLLTLLAGSASAGIRYVNVALTTGANDGTSWANAFRGVAGLQSALAGAGGDQIWVAQGTYKPNASNFRDIPFVLQNAVEIYGGFAGTETALDQRDWVAHPTILSGDLSGNDGSGIYTDNSYHVLKVGPSAYILDGFTVRGGNADGSSASLKDRGGGLIGDGTAGPWTIPIVRNCIFRENRAGSSGGACYVYHTDPIFSDCRFESNVSGAEGGALYSDQLSNTRCRRCVFTGNTAASGSAIKLYDSPAKFTNCVIWDNT